jgi:hypothetical protein
MLYLESTFLHFQPIEIRRLWPLFAHYFIFYLVPIIKPLNSPNLIGWFFLPINGRRNNINSYLTCI